MILPVIMAGGNGTRLWPLSRGNYPKQFLPLHGEHTMLQQTLIRLAGIEHQPCMLICNEEHRFIAAEQVRQSNVAHSGIFLEPVGRNTAPAIALAAFKALEQYKNSTEGEAVLLVLAADHVIEDVDAFQIAVKNAQVHAVNDKLVTFGIVAESPETGYGYIKCGQPVACNQDKSAFTLDSFVEKPDLDTAKKYLSGGDYLWNSGMFMFKASVYLNALKQFSPQIYAACELAMQTQVIDSDFIRVDNAAFTACPEDSIDYAVMEPMCQQDKASAIVVPLVAGWNDIGGFSALWDMSDKNQDGNACKGDVITLDCHDSLIFSDDKLIATIGVNDLVIVSTKDTVLVAHKDKAQEVKTIVNKLKQQQRSEVTFHREVYRPWGKYDSIDSSERFQAKRITVNPGAKLSVQMHHHRAEHWIVVSGTAKVTNGDSTMILTENQSTFIPIGTIHSLENPGVIDLELIEVQSGSYLGEDDIVRFEDRYGRVESNK